jgi:hypothetical protein
MDISTTGATKLDHRSIDERTASAEGLSQWPTIGGAACVCRFVASDRAALAYLYETAGLRHAPARPQTSESAC